MQTDSKVSLSSSPAESSGCQLPDADARRGREKRSGSCLAGGIGSVRELVEGCWPVERCWPVEICWPVERCWPVESCWVGEVDAVEWDGSFSCWMEGQRRPLGIYDGSASKAGPTPYEIVGAAAKSVPGDESCSANAMALPSPQSWRFAVVSERWDGMGSSGRVTVARRKQKGRQGGSERSQCMEMLVAGQQRRRASSGRGGSLAGEVGLWSGLGGRNKVCSDGQLGVEVTLIPVSLGTLRHTSR